LEQGDSGSLDFFEQKSADTATVRKPHKFPWLLVGAVVVIGAAALYFLVLNKKYTLTVTLGPGTTGTPAATTKFKKGESVPYNYSLQAGHGSLQVKLDGVVVHAHGTVYMNSNHTLAVSATPVPELSSPPYVSDNDVSFYRRFEPEHGGVDLSATRAITILAMCAGTFTKKLYYHPTSLRWQVNAEIVVGDYALDCLFEPGAQVSKEVGQAQFDALLPDGAAVRAGDALGRLLLAPGKDISLFHFGVRWRPTARTDCPLDYCTAEVKAKLQALARRDHPGWEVCVGNGG
jgi:hypothetical protein